MRVSLIVVPLLFTAAGCIGGSSSSSAGPTRPAVVCTPATVHYGSVPAAVREAGIPSGVPWVEDSTASVTGSLYYYTPILRRHAHAIIGTRGQAESGRVTKILWWVHGKGSPALTIVGNRTDAAGSFRPTITGPTLGDNTHSHPSSRFPPRAAGRSPSSAGQHRDPSRSGQAGCATKPPGRSPSGAPRSNELQPVAERPPTTAPARRRGQGADRHRSRVPRPGGAIHEGTVKPGAWPTVTRE